MPEKYRSRRCGAFTQAGRRCANYASVTEETAGNVRVYCRRHAWLFEESKEEVDDDGQDNVG